MEGRDIVMNRISDLPCPVLAHILSFLPTQEAVQTCILAKRWSNIWASLRVLEFDNQNFESDTKFLGFVDGVLNNLENKSLDTFKLSLASDITDDGQLFEILHRAVECNPRVISIYSHSPESLDFSGPIFASASVEEISLTFFPDADGYFTCFEPKSIKLPSLKKLRLENVEINYGTIAMLFSGCPLLEELVMDSCFLDVAKFSSDKLNKLVVSQCFLQGGMHISCPSVVSLRIDIYDNGALILSKNMWSLVSADVSFCHGDYLFDGDLRLTLVGLSNATNLRLHGLCRLRYFDMDELVGKRESNCPIFKNLTMLTLRDLDSKYNWFLVDWFLQHSPNVKKLTLHFCKEKFAKPYFERASPFQHEYLETAEIILSEGTSDEVGGELVSALNRLVKTIGRITIVSV